MIKPTDGSSPATGRRTVVVDPSAVMRGALADLLHDARVADIVGEAGNWRSGLDLCRRTGARLLITDLTIVVPEDGISLCRQVKRLPSRPSVLMFSSRNDSAAIAACMVNEVDGFVHRSAPASVVLDAVRALTEGGPAWFLGTRADEPAQPGLVCRQIPPNVLTERELDVLNLVLQRYSNGEIADTLTLAYQTVKNYVSNVLQKLGAANRRELLSSYGLSALAGEPQLSPAARA